MREPDLVIHLLLAKDGDRGEVLKKYKLWLENPK